MKANPSIELVDEPVTAIAGVTDSDAENLKAAFGIPTVEDLATLKYAFWA